MSEFREALEQFLAGTVEADEVRRRISAAAAQDPQRAPAMLAVIEAYRSAGRLTPEFASQLKQIVQYSSSPQPHVQREDEATQVSARDPPAPASAGVPPPIAAAVPPAAPVVPPSQPPPLPVSPQVAAPSVEAAAPPFSRPRSSPPSSRPSASSTGQPSLGSVLKDRFVLESIVAGGDKGGMGVVFKALDRIKEEARDRNPYVAIKVLNEDFKRHPDSMMALQREARRAQTLAHPNIITVYDFDRDGDNVFMAMELLNGSPLDEVIRANRDRGGLPVDEALKIIVQLGRGLSYAHANNIVHSDFKPSNAFLTKEGVVKVLDFGIARATKIADGEKTRFDAGSLGAMTLPYASCEQFERQDPDPSDDVYALSVVSYELLSGHHPFERPDPDRPDRLIRTDAIAARNANMKPAPAPIPGLSGQQWRTLRRGLAFKRADRLRDAAAFLEGMTPRRLPLKTLMVTAAAVLLLLITSTMLFSSYLQRSRLQALTQKLQSSDPTVVAAALQALQKYGPEERAPVLLNDAVQGNLLNYFIGRAHEQFNVEAGKYDYAGALATLKQAEGLSKVYEDSRQLNDALDRLESDRKAQILKQATAFESQLNQGLLIASQGAQNVRSTLAVIRQLDPGYPLLNDKRLPIAFANQIRSNVESDHLALASALLTAGLQFAPTDPALLDLQDRISHQQNTAQSNVQTLQLEQAVRPLGQASATLADFRGNRSQLEALRAAQPSSTVLITAQNQLTKLIDPLVAAAVAQRQVNDAQATVNEFADLLPAAVVARQRADIGSVTGNTQAGDDVTTQLRAKIDKEVASPKAEDAWVNTLQHDLQSLAAVAGAADPAITAARTRTSQAFLELSRRKLSDGLLSEAQRTLDLARQFGLAPDVYQAQVTAMNDARTKREADERARASASRLLAAKQGVLDQAGGDNIDVAKAQFAELQKTLPVSDPFVTTDAPRAIAEAYIARAHRSAKQTQFEQAYEEAQAAEQAAPNMPEFKELEQRFLSARELARSFATVADYRPLKPALDRVRDAERSTDHREIQGGLLRLVNERIGRVAAQDPTEAGRLRDTAVPLFPNGGLMKLNPAAARSQSAPGATPPTTVTSVGGSNPPAQTQTLPTQSQATPPAPTPAVQTSPTQTTQTAKSKPSRSQEAATNASTPNDSSNASVAGSAASAPSGPCSSVTSDTASGSACRDNLNNGGRGPEMVIVAAGGAQPSFAIMRNEASNADYNAYCAAVKGCKPIDSDASLPVSAISVDDAQKYAVWLSAASGAKYRLPTDREWLRAAGRGSDPDANCTGGKPGRGTALRASTLGSLNDYGLRNVTGNVQEWATTAAGGLKAMGGAIGDPIQICQTEFSRPQNGQADSRTGFRLLREMR